MILKLADRTLSTACDRCNATGNERGPESLSGGLISRNFSQP